MPKTAGELCAVDVYEPLSTGRGGVCYILICLDVFTKFVKLLLGGQLLPGRAYIKMISTETVSEGMK
jgi:hypothetical protein